MSPKEDSKAKDATVVSVNVEDYTKTRDSVIISLAQLQSAVSDLSRAYINHTNTVLNPGSSGIDLGGLTSGITNTLFESGLLGARPTSPGAKSEVGDKKKRKRAPPDPNAPKRALTPFFLYMQHNRAKIAEELGGSAKPKAVSDEGTRRWAEMAEPHKEVWKKLYADNLAVYKEKMKAYKAGLPVHEDDNTRAANQLQQDVEGVSGSGAEETDDEDDEEGHAKEPEQEHDEEEEEASESSPEPEPVKQPTPPRSTASKRRRSEGKTKETAAPAAEKKESPEKKKRTSARKLAEEPPASARKAASTPADNKRGGKKKRKSEAAADE